MIRSETVWQPVDRAMLELVTSSNSHRAIVFRLETANVKASRIRSLPFKVGCKFATPFESGKHILACSTFGDFVYNRWVD